MNKENIPPEFDGIDNNGFFRQDGYGKWRSLTIENGILTYLKPKLRLRSMEEVMRLYELQRPNRGNEGRHNKY